MLLQLNDAGVIIIHNPKNSATLEFSPVKQRKKNKQPFQSY